MNLEEFLEANRISQEDWDKADIDTDTLVAIESDYRKQIPHLNEAAEFLARVLQKCKHVHSVRWRVKDPDHVLEKIIRKRASGSEKYGDVSVQNYSELITDLVGVRVLHLFKHEWLDIHEYIKNSWVPVEDVVAYIREGDEGAVIESYNENQCNVEVHPAGYRSIHYIISTQPTLKKVLSEIQVRTIFEEGWSEIDHKIRYPNFMDNKLVSYFLTIFNRMSGSADEMGTFVNDLVADIKWKELQLEAKQKEQDEHLQKIEDLAQELSNERTENKSKESNVSKLKLEIATLRKNSISIPDISLSKSRLAEIEKMTSVTRDALKYSDIAKLNSRQMDALKISDMGKFSSAYDEIMSNEKFAKQLKLNESLLEKYRSQVSIGTKVNKKVRKPKDEN
ncbi:RelA/SpoT domain-containing protein [Vibrio coralliirubri]|uniref:RelA/SpoT domain-containing protein n=1 Tax=Vibrio coralliirubri TaxID=1516159 RepID=UPI002FE06617